MAEAQKVANAQAVKTTSSSADNLRIFRLVLHLVVDRGAPFLLVPLIAFGAVQLSQVSPNDLTNLWDLAAVYSFQLAVAVAIAFAVFLFYISSQPRRMFLVDFTCYLPPDSLCLTVPEMEKRARSVGKDDDDIAFQKKVFSRSGLGDRTAFPPSLLKLPMEPSMKAAREESEMVIFSAMDDLFARTGVKPKDISVLVVNCSIFCPTPSTSAMIVNKYKMRSNIQSYQLGGMGCSAGLISVKLARDLLQVYPGSYAIVVSTENITQNIYHGKRRDMQLPNCLFRVGGAAVLLSNKRSESWRSKYELVTAVRTHLGADDKSYRCVYQEEDEEGHVGVSLSKDLMNVASNALRTNLTTLGPMVLPLSEKLMFAGSFIARKVLRLNMKPYQPDFKVAFEHFCIHAGGRAVLDELEKGLQLSESNVEASRMALYRFGNTSSSTLWYELSYIEAKGRVKRGDRVCQIGFGSGFKCNSVVWKAIRSIRADQNKGPWADCIDQLPVEPANYVTYEQIMAAKAAKAKAAMEAQAALDAQAAEAKVESTPTDP